MRLVSWRSSLSVPGGRSRRGRSLFFFLFLSLSLASFSLGHGLPAVSGESNIDLATVRLLCHPRGVLNVQFRSIKDRGDASRVEILYSTFHLNLAANVQKNPMCKLKREPVNKNQKKYLKVLGKFDEGGSFFQLQVRFCAFSVM